ncbi:tyrosine-type recombinase/integrase [Morganella morganii]|uniref:tyrosine-type recombinase/integrase n=1 Tax=Morganella morganii TaxID=582 RepID=UPI00339CDEA4
MAKFTDREIRAWIKAGETFEGRSDGNGLYLRLRAAGRSPEWRFRYKIAKVPRVMALGKYPDLSLAGARAITRELSARVALGHDVAAERKLARLEAAAQVDAERKALRVSGLFDEYFERQIVPNWKKHIEIRQRFDKDVIPAIGGMKATDITPRDIDTVIKRIVDRGAISIAKSVLTHIVAMFNYAVRRGVMDSNPAAAFNVSDAGGKSEARNRWLSRDEIVTIFRAFKDTSLSRSNELAFKLLMALCVRKMELAAARWDEFNLDEAVWNFPAERSKNGDSVDIPLCADVVAWLKELKAFSCGSPYLFPGRNPTEGHIAPSTLDAALGKVRHALPADMSHFTIHDFRRTARSHLAALGVDPFVAERCLNHRIKGVEGIYNRHDYFDERRAALTQWCALLVSLEKGEDYNVIPLVTGHMKIC